MTPVTPVYTFITLTLSLFTRFSLDRYQVSAQSASGVHPARDSPLEYHIHEERSGRTPLGHGIIVDYGLDKKYPIVVQDSLWFSVLTPAQPAGLFVVDERRGYISTTQSIDRDRICPGLDQCIVSFDVAVLPIQYFQSIKVKVCISNVSGVK